MIAVIDYDAGNIRSVTNALARLGKKAFLTDDPIETANADFVILPGVGSFGHAMFSLEKGGLARALKDRFERNRPTLGICLGLQLMFESSEESPGVSGLGFFKGSVKKLETKSLTVPHTGWTTISATNGSFAPFDNEYFYFVHSYAVHAEDSDIVAAYADYGERFVAAVKSGNITACQFHPEKSGKAGLKLLNMLTETGGAQ